MTTREEADAAFIAGVEALIAEHWKALAPWACEDDEYVAESADYPNPYVGAWVMVVGGQSLDNPRAGSFSAWWSPDSQMSFTSAGLLRSVLRGMEAD